MSGWLNKAGAGDALEMTGPLGSFYLRRSSARADAGGRHRSGAVPVDAGGDGAQGVQQPVHLIYGVTRDQDLVWWIVLKTWPSACPGSASPPVWPMPRPRIRARVT
jgi:benzoate/toluate 1,2-dioxygenase reductase subunit